MPLAMYALNASSRGSAAPHGGGGSCGDLLQHVVDEQVEGPLSELRCPAALPGAVVSMLANTSSGLRFCLAQALESLVAVAAIVDAKAVENFCAVEIVGDKCAYTHVFCQLVIHIVFLSILFSGAKVATIPHRYYRDLRIVSI